MLPFSFRLLQKDSRGLLQLGAGKVLDCFTQALCSAVALNGSRTPTLAKSAFA